MKGYIYIIKNAIDDNVYVGQTTKDVDVRFSQHINSSKSESTNQLHNKMFEFGVDNFTYETVVTIESESEDVLLHLLNEAEIMYIELNQSKNNGFNSNFGGGSFLRKDYEVYDGEKTRINFNVTQEQKNKFNRLAKQSNLSLTSFILKKCLGSENKQRVEAIDENILNTLLNVKNEEVEFYREKYESTISNLKGKLLNRGIKNDSDWENERKK